MNFWDVLLWFFWFYVLVAYLMVLFTIVADIFRDSETNGWAKAVWILALVIFPIITALIYIGVRGRKMNERQAARARQARDETDSYIRTVAAVPATSPAEEIGKAKALLDSGSITQIEYDGLKARVLAPA